MGHDSTVRRPIDVGGVSAEVLRRRISLVLWIVVVGNLLFAATDPWLNPVPIRALALVKVGVIGAQLVGLTILSRRLRHGAAVAVGLLSGSAASLGGVIAGVVVQDAFTTPMLCTAAALLAAAVIPWGTRAQIGAALINLAGGAATLLLVAGLPSAREPIVGMTVVTALSVYIARELARQRAAQARAALALQHHQAEVAHVLRVSALGEMAAQLAHELTQPLCAIANYAAGCRRRLEKSVQPAPEIVDVVDRIGREALRAGAIIRRMREFLQKSEPQRRAIDVNALVREVAELLDGEARERGVAVDLLLQPDLPAVAADGIEIEQVLINLARNAIEAMHGTPRAPMLAIETRCGHPDTIEVFVRDSGPGLPEGGADAIFEAFYTTKPRGLGMGLAISRTIVELHGGTLAASSGPAGATFRVTLPVRAAAG
ncbi:MAG TPA: ATP-binding protein [Candidatus Dormibacteraeota bacterium]|nr:ATP-binding protein [Candidatus Dormibacteraeota bacterium]